MSLPLILEGKAVGNNVHQVRDGLLAQVLGSVTLEEERNLRSATKSVASRVYVDVERVFVCARAENILCRNGVLCCLRSKRSDLDAVRNQETGNDR